MRFYGNIFRIVGLLALALGSLSCSVAHVKEQASIQTDPVSTALSNTNVSESLIPYQTGSAIRDGDPVLGSLNGAVNLSQGWTEATQQGFYTTSQGSRILPYTWYLYLEQATNKKPFRSASNIRRFAYLPSSPTQANPDGLSVGFVKDIAKNGEQWMGFTCAACHTTEVSYKGTTLRIDGGPTMGNFELFNNDLVAALEKTLDDNRKFKRFADHVLPKNYNQNLSQALRDRLNKRINVLKNRNTINHPSPEQVPYGYARVDAIGAIFNQVLSVFDHDPNNARASTAPVSYPFLWGTHQSDVVQWTGFAPNGPFTVGGLIRNGGEVLGVYGQININHRKSYPSSLDFDGLGWLESWVAQLKAPRWPEYLPPINQALKAKGEGLYKEECAACHQVISSSAQGKPYKAILTPLSDIGTDSQEILNMLSYRNSNRYYERQEFDLFGSPIGYITTGLDPLVNSVMGAMAHQPKAAIEAILRQIAAGEMARLPSNGIQVSSAEKKIIEKKMREALELIQIAYSHIKDIEAFCTKNNMREDECSKFSAFLKKSVEDVEIIKNIDKAFEAFGESSQQKEENVEQAKDEVYKARPLNGIWATAPYLHNGSVINLWELLLPAKERISTFYVGNRELDVKHVGLVADKVKYSSLYDTRLLGNSNSGHEYGVDLPDDDKWALIEYMKSL